MSAPNSKKKIYLLIVLFFYFYFYISLSSFSEQYEAFLKFNHDQIHRRFGDTPVSCEYILFNMLNVRITVDMWKNYEPQHFTLYYEF